MSKCYRIRHRSVVREHEMRWQRMSCHIWGHHAAHCTYIIIITSRQLYCRVKRPLLLLVNGWLVNNTVSGWSWLLMIKHPGLRIWACTPACNLRSTPTMRFILPSRTHLQPLPMDWAANALSLSYNIIQRESTQWSDELCSIAMATPSSAPACSSGDTNNPISSTKLIQGCPPHHSHNTQLSTTSFPSS